MISPSEAAKELLARRKARSGLLAYINYTKKIYHNSYFSQVVCDELDRFILDVEAGKRPILILAAPPQHGKSEILSRKLPAFLLGRFPHLRIGSASFGDELAGTLAQDVRRTLASDEHLRLFPASNVKQKYDINRMGEFTAPGGTGSYIGVGVGSGLTGRPLDIGIIDDPIKNAKESLSPTTKESIWSWYQSVFKTRLSERSGQIIMATRWAEDDLSGRVIALHKGDDRLRLLTFPAINAPGEVNYNPKLPEGALVPELHSIEQLLEIKRETSEYFWSGMYQGSPRALGGNVFRESGIRYYYPKDLPLKFDKVATSIDCTFKDTDGTDYVVAQVWGKFAANAYLLDQVRERLSFTNTVKMVVAMHEKWPKARAILIEDKANGPAVIDTLKSKIPGIIPVEPDGSKLARAHAITAYWEAGNIYIPHEDVAPWVKDFVSEVTGFPTAANDDQVDAMTQGIRWLYPLFSGLKITQDAINKAMGR